jgi:hypothetical protein
VLLVGQFLLLPALGRLYARASHRVRTLRRLAANETAGAVSAPPSEGTTEVGSDTDVDYVKERLQTSWVAKNGGLVVLAWHSLRLTGLIALVAMTAVSVGLAHGGRERSVLIALTSFYVRLTKAQSTCRIPRFADRSPPLCLDRPTRSHSLS